MVRSILSTNSCLTKISYSRPCFADVQCGSSDAGNRIWTGSMGIGHDFRLPSPAPQQSLVLMIIDNQDTLRASFIESHTKTVLSCEDEAST
jgi:hypothetical protein